MPCATRPPIMRDDRAPRKKGGYRALTPCPTPEKQYYHSRRVAKLAAKRTQLKPYRCSCGGFHLTSLQTQILSEADALKMRFKGIIE